MTNENKNKEQTLKVVFGLMIFAFSLALAYFVASYLRSNHYFDYWGALMIAGGIFIVIGALVHSIVPVSLGFLFSADVLVLHVLTANFGDLSDVTKAFFVGLILAVLYLLAWLEYSKEDYIEITKPPTSDIEEEEVETTSAGESDIFQDEETPKTEDLNAQINKIDASAFNKVTFYPTGKSAFSTTEQSIIKIALYTKNVFNKTEFNPGELDDYYKSFISLYKPTLTPDKVRIVLEKLKDFVSTGGRLEII